MAKVWTLAIWHVAEGKWRAAITSPVQRRIETVCEVIRALTPTFCCVVEVERDDVELIEDLVSRLEPLSPLDVYVSLLEEKDFVEEDAQEIAREATKAVSGDVPVH